MREESISKLIEKTKMKIVKNYASVEKDVLKYIEKKHNIELNKNDLSDISFSAVDMDSLDTAELILSIEEKYGIDLEDQEVYHTKTIRNFIDCVYKKLNK